MATYLYEGDVGSVQPDDRIIHAGVNSCMTISCICANRIVGGHAVMIPNEQDPLMRVMQRIRLMLKGPVARLYVIGSLGNWQDQMGYEMMADFLGTNHFAHLGMPTVSRVALQNWICNQLGVVVGAADVYMMTTGRLEQGNATVDVEVGNGRLRIARNAQEYLDEAVLGNWQVPENMVPREE
jgi:hypothetical protein